MKRISAKGRRWILGLAIATALALLITAINIVPITKQLAGMANRTPGEVIRHLRVRLIGHNKLEAVLLGPLAYVEGRIVREPPTQAGLSSLGKGQQNYALSPVRYSPIGLPLDEPAAPWPASLRPSGTTVYASTSAELLRAIETATEGQTILIAPGRYPINQRVSTRNAGSKELPITVRAAAPGQVTIEFASVEGFSVYHPFWVFENLRIRGVCAQQRDCEHAFHVVGKAKNTVIRNNWIEDFNAHLKINGLEGDWPDGGLIQYNTITGSRGRETMGRPLTPIDLVGASNWRYSDNIITNFIKADGNQVSFGAFMKGAGHGGRMERNLIICTPSAISQPGARVGLSFGGGGTFPAAVCRDGQCAYEHKDGLIANNIIAHCNDDGIDINRSVDVVVAHNTLINTGGVVMRRGPASARVVGNLLEGSIRNREAGPMKADFNDIGDMASLFDNADALGLGWRRPPENIPSIAAVPEDFCRRRRADGTLPGALADASPCKNASR